MLRGKRKVVRGRPDLGQDDRDLNRFLGGSQWLREYISAMPNQRFLAGLLFLVFSALHLSGAESLVLERNFLRQL